MNYEDGNNDIRPLAPSNLEGELKIENFNGNGNFNFNVDGNDNVNFNFNHYSFIFNHPRCHCIVETYSSVTS